MSVGLLNLGRTAYFGNCKPFIDIGTSGKPWSNQTYVIDGEWLQDVPNGVASFSSIVQVTDVGGFTDWTYQRSGTYKLVWNGNLTFTVGGSGTSNGRTLTPPAGWGHCYAVDVVGNNPGFTITCTNTSGAAASCKPSGLTNDAMKFYHADDETDLLAGKVFQSHFVQSIIGAPWVRVMDWMDTSASGFNNDGTASISVFEFADIAAERDRVWITKNGVQSAMPASVIGKLASELGKNIWLNIPGKFTPACITAFASAVATAMGSAGSLILEGNNEIWNASWPWAGPAKFTAAYWTEGKSIVDGSGNALAGYTFTINAVDNTVETAADLSAVLPTGRALNFLYNGGNRPAALTVGGAVVDYQFSAWVRQISATSFKLYPSSADATADTNVYTLDGPLQDYVAYPGGDASNSNLTHLTACGNAELVGYAYQEFVAELGESRVDIVLCGQAASANQVNAQFQYTNPRTGNQMKVDATYWGIAPYFNVRAGGSISDASETWRVNNLASLTDAWFTEAIENETAFQLTSVQNHQAMLASKAPALVPTSYELGSHILTNTGNKPLSLRHKEYLDSEAGRSSYADYYETAINGHLYHFAQFHDTGDYTIGAQWGLTESQFLAKTPRHQWFDETFGEQPVPSGLSDTASRAGGGRGAGPSEGMRRLARALREDDELLILIAAAVPIVDNVN